MSPNHSMVQASFLLVVHIGFIPVRVLCQSGNQADGAVRFETSARPSRNCPSRSGLLPSLSLDSGLVKSFSGRSPVPDNDPFRGPGRFTTSRWSLILTAGDVDSDASRAALEQLVTQYWYPLYSFARRKGHAHQSAQDLTQGFFLHLLEKGCLKAADPSRGRFRTFLLTAFKNFLANEWNHSRAQKRGGDQPTLSLDGAQERFHAEPSDYVTPETSFDREWAESLVRKALQDLREEMSRTGSRNRYRLLKVYLLGETPSRTYREVGRELGLTEAAVKVAVHRMRRRLGALLRNEIAQTVQDSRMVDDELRYLMQALSR